MAITKQFSPCVSAQGFHPSSMFSNACYGMSSVASLPDGFMDTSGLTGSPANLMFNAACYGMENVTDGNIVIGSGITLTDSNIVNAVGSMCRNMVNWTDQLYRGTDVIHTILTPTSRTYCFLGNINMPDYATIDVNWK